MALMLWEQRYSVETAMDTEHKQWFEILNRLHDAMLRGDGRAAQQTILREMVTYTSTHFQHEEAMLRNKHYPDLPAHHGIHAGFTGKVRDLEAKMKRGEPVLTVELMDFLKGWLQSHILVQDAKYGAWLRANP